MKFTIASVLAFAASTYALSVTSPASLAQIPVGQSIPVTWTSVTTDQTSLSIVLVNNAISPSVNIPIASNIPTSQGSFTVSPSAISAAKSAQGYQINLVSTQTGNQGGILAQSQQFSLTGSTSSSSSGSSSVVASSSSVKSSSASTVTPTAVVSASTAARASSSAAPFPIVNGTTPTTGAGGAAAGTGAGGAAAGTGAGAAAGTGAPGAKTSAFPGAATSNTVQIGGVFAVALMGLAVLF